MDLAAVGVPVSSATAGALVRYIDAYLTLKLSEIDDTQVTRHMGWQGRECQAFVLGESVLATEMRSVRFQPDSDGTAQFAEGFRARGSLNEWARVLQLIRPYPRVVFGI